MKKKIENMMNNSDFSGIIFIEKGSETIEITSGNRDFPNELKVSHNTKFGMASVSKFFVSVAIVYLIEQQKLAFETKLSEIFETLGTIDLHITIQELLTHQSNVPDYFDETILSDYSDLWLDVPNYRMRKNDDLFPLFINKSDQTSRHTKEFKYNNSGYIILASVIQKITKMNFDTFIQEIIFDKLGMTHTGYYELDKLPKNTAIGYIKDEHGEMYANIYSIDVKGTGAGGCFSTAQDMLRFWKGLYAYKIISSLYLDKIIDNEFSKVANYGLGCWLLPAPNNEYRLPYLQGEDPGVLALSLYDMKRDFQLTIFSNNGSDIWKIRKEIFELIY